MKRETFLIYFIFRWKDVSKFECSVQCGRGMRQRIIKCMKEDITMQISHVVPEEHCVHLGPKPSLEEKCYGRCRNSTWIFSEWTEVSFSTDIYESKKTIFK